jgi:hypothetical protein
MSMVSCSFHPEVAVVYETHIGPSLLLFPFLSHFPKSLFIADSCTNKSWGMSNGGSGMLPPHVSTNLKSKWSNRCEEYWSNPCYFLSPSKAALVSLFLSHLLPSLFNFSVEEAASCRRDRLPKSISSKPKLDHPNLAKAARQHPYGYALYMPLVHLLLRLSHSKLAALRTSVVALAGFGSQCP